ncbi:MAG TPA: hypothetical protein VE011_04095 [Candidatus Dormibacteraeota bacterium]|nr:hypothetical protein [Candidatus Dormibacteraeota bacterium]
MVDLRSNSPLGRPDPAAYRARGWGWLPALSLVAAAGVVAVSSSFALVGAGFQYAEPLFWIGLLLIAAPITVRLTAKAPGTAERVGLVLVLGLVLEVVHFVSSPAGFTNYDALLHLRTITDILSTGHLFTPNPLLPVSPVFPGLEIVTAAVVQISGVDPFTAAAVVLAFARILFAIGLFALYREASSSERVAGLATAIYMLNPNFTFFDSGFSYETLALPLVPVVLLITAIRAQRGGGVLLAAALAASSATLAITHHVSTYGAAALLVGWIVVNRIVHRRDRYRRWGIIFSTALMLSATALWLVFAGPVVVGYLAPPIAAAINEAIRLVTTGVGRTPFVSATGQVAPVWERAVGLGTAALLTLAIPIGLAPLIRRYRDNSLALLLGLLALAYPLSLVARLTPTGSEAAGRSLGFVFLGLSFVVALGVIATAETIAGRVRGTRDPVRWTIRGSPARSQQVWTGAFVAIVCLAILGGAVIGTAPATRFPGPYLVGADSRSIDNESIAAAGWTLAVLGPNRRVAGDRVNRLLLGSYGQADVVFYTSGHVETWQIFLSPVVGPLEIARIKAARIDYILIDRRLASSLPLVPFYYEEGEIFERRHATPILATVLAKWDSVPRVDRIYDSGDIQLYDVRRLAGAR